MIIRKHAGRTSARAEIDFKFPTTLVKRSKWYLACCPALDVCSQGGTEDEARANLAEALKLFIISCLKRKTLDAVIDECVFLMDGFRFNRQTGSHRVYEKAGVLRPVIIPTCGSVDTLIIKSK
jgi:predicted RNase H-like HicB family nuclease